MTPRIERLNILIVREDVLSTLFRVHTLLLVDVVNFVYLNLIGLDFSQLNSLIDFYTIDVYELSTCTLDFKNSGPESDDVKALVLNYYY